MSLPTFNERKLTRENKTKQTKNREDTFLPLFLILYIFISAGLLLIQITSTPQF